MKINDYKINNNNNISMGFDNYFGENGYMYETMLDKMENINDVYLNLDKLNKIKD